MIQYNTNYKYSCVFDIECTCWQDNEKNHESNNSQEIIQIGGIKFNVGTLNIVDTFNIFIKPTINPTLSDFCISMTNITQEKIDQEGVSIEEGIEQFFEFTNNCNHIYSWGNFDIHYLLNEIMIYNKFNCKNDKKIEFLTSLLLKHKNIKELVLYSCNLKPRDLEYVLNNLNIKIKYPLHDALNDSHNEFKILKHILKKKNKYAK